MHKVGLGVAVLAASLFVAPVAHAQMKVTSDDIKNGAVGTKEMEANVFGCNGQNMSPSLKWTGAPDGTKSFAINLYDPDAPTGSGFWHWVVFNIPVSTTSLPKNAGDVKAKLMPDGAIQSRTDYGARWLWRHVPAARRQAASLSADGLRGRRRQAAIRQGRPGFGSRGRFRTALPFEGQGRAELDAMAGPSKARR